MRKRILSITLFLSVSFLSLPAVAQDALPVTVAFECTDGTTPTARYVQEGVWLFLSGKGIMLPQTRSASGAKYADGNITFWTKGNEAMLIQRGRKASQCTVDRKASVWEAAKLDGADFRGIGNTPNWELLIFSDAMIISADDGLTNLVFKRASIFKDRRSGTMTYRAKNGKHSVTVTLSNEACTDTMNADTYQTKVTILLDGNRTLTGCGRALH